MALPSTFAKSVSNMAAEWMSGSPLSSSQMIEVESKFRVPPDFEKVLELKGAKLMRQTTFTDVYFDAPNHELSLNGYWLRKRNNKWELKIQKLKIERWIESNREIEDENEIINEIVTRLRSFYPNIDRDYTSVEDIVQRTSCKQIACITTNRAVYQMPNRVVVDLDQASFGYQVGELEVVVSNEKNVDSAKEAIQRTADFLGIECRSDIPSKLEKYIFSNCRSHHEQLVKCGFFVKQLK